MIKSFRCKETEKLFNDISSRRFQNIQKAARRKLEMLEAALKLEDLRNPPGNKLEALRGDRVGSYSIQINEQFRLCFKWIGNEAREVEIVDYH
jgi:proteic killer suppression protein